jgi:hypothetical protein
MVIVTRTGRIAAILPALNYHDGRFSFHTNLKTGAADGSVYLRPRPTLNEGMKGSRGHTRQLKVERAMGIENTALE